MTSDARLHVIYILVIEHIFLLVSRSVKIIPSSFHQLVISQRSYLRDICPPGVLVRDQKAARVMSHISYGELRRVHILQRELCPVSLTASSDARIFCAPYFDVHFPFRLNYWHIFVQAPVRAGWELFQGN